jgi:D-alanyl-D-alanine carboxypeptidase
MLHSLRFAFIATILLTAELAAGQMTSSGPIFEDPKFEIRQPNRPISGVIVDESLNYRLQRALDSVYMLTSDVGRYGITASVILPNGTQWNGTSGISSPGIPMTPDHLIEAASNTKTFVTAAIMKLSEQGMLSLDDKITMYLPAYPNVDTNITIRQLLAHSGGVYDYMNDDAESTLIYDAYVARPDHKWTPDEILNGGYIGKANFRPGLRNRYSNTGFLLLGLVVERVSGLSYAQYVRQNFIDPLGLIYTFNGSDEQINGEFADNWIPENGGNEAVNLGEIEKTGHLSLAWAAGYMVSRPADLAKWSHELYMGNLLAKTSLNEMLKIKTWSDQSRYGLGTAEVPYGPKRFYGHTGRLLGFQSYMFTNPVDSVTFVIVMNSDPLMGDITLNDYALAVLDQIYLGATSSVDTKPAARVYQIEGGRTLKVEVPESEQVTSVKLFDLLGREVNVEIDQVMNGARIELDRLTKGVYTYSIGTTKTHYSGKIAR